MKRSHAQNLSWICSVFFTLFYLQGNTTVNFVTEHSLFTNDKTVPVISFCTISSSNINTGFAIPGSIVTVRFITTEKITTPVVTVAGHTAAVTLTGSNANDWSASYMMQASDIPGQVAFVINYTDLDGNVASPVSATTNTTTVIFSDIGTKPSFVSGSASSISLCLGSSGTNVAALLSITGVALSDQFSLTLITVPKHGRIDPNDLPKIITVRNSTVAPTTVFYGTVEGYTGTDAFVVSATNGISTITTTIQVTINPPPVIALTAPQTFVCGAALPITITASGAITYKWQRNGLLVGDVTGPQLSTGFGGLYDVTGTDANGCTAGTQSGPLNIQLRVKPSVGFSYNSYCAGYPITFTNGSVANNNTGPLTYVWSDGNANNSTDISPKFTFAQGGTINMKLKAIPTQCPALSDSVTKTITIDVPATPIRMQTINTTANTLVPLQARTFGTVYTWAPATGLSSVNTASTNATITAEQQYIVSIGVASGCITADTVLIRIFSSVNIIVPNVFTPNGDGVNDKLLPNLVDIKTFYYFRVFNRAGKKVFETNDPNQGWDGKVNGEKQPSGTYLWTAAGADKNGMLIHKEGSITVLR